MKIDYYECGLVEVLDYFSKAFKLKNGEIYKVEPFVDTARGKVLFKLFIQEKPKSTIRKLPKAKKRKADEKGGV